MCVQQKQYSQLEILVAKAKGKELKDKFIPVEYHPQDIIAARNILTKLQKRKDRDSSSSSSENVNCRVLNKINYEF